MEILNSLRHGAAPCTALLHTSSWQDREPVLIAFQEHSSKYFLKPATSQLCHLDHFLHFVYKNVMRNNAKHSAKAVMWVFFFCIQGPLVYQQQKLDWDSLL